MKNTRSKEIEQQLTAYSKPTYSKQEFFQEFDLLQQQMADMLGLDKGFSGPNARLQDVYKRLEQMNVENKRAANEPLALFKKHYKAVISEMRGLFCGERGERLTQKSIDTVRRYRKVLRNIEFQNGDHNTELDFIVLTASKVFLIEVKNSTRDIVIDDRGNYKRIAYNGECVLDKNIGQQMNEKEFLLRDVLSKAGIDDVEIESLVVFTNSSVQVTNNYEFIKICYLSKLPHIIDQATSESEISKQKIVEIKNAILEAHCEQPYTTDIDFSSLKSSFAQLLAKLEEAQAKKERMMKHPIVAFFSRLNNAVQCLIA